MSSFNPNNHKLTPIEWQEIAKDTNEETGAQFTVIAGVVLGLFAGAAASPVTGLLVAIYFGYKAWQDTQAANRNDAAIESYGCVAHLLKESHLRDYVRQVGADTAIQEITFAVENGYRTTPAAIEFIESRGIDVEALMSPALPAAREAQTEQQQQVVEDAATAVPKHEAVAQAGSIATAIDSRTPPPSQPSPVAYLLGDRLRTALIISVSGGGKDILLSNALRVFLAAYPAFRIVVADCKDDPKEYGYYDGLPNVSVHRLNVAIASDGEVVQWVDQWVEEFVHLPEQALLICNEGTLIRAKSKRYVQAVDGLVSSGDSRQKYCWEAGQSAHTDDLQINGAARSRFRMLIIGLKGEEMQIEAVLSAKFVADSARNMGDIKTQMLRSPVSRAWCDGQRWFAMPALENYSGYDRDSRSMLAGFAMPQQQDARAKLEELYQDAPCDTSQDVETRRSETESLRRPIDAASSRFCDTSQFASWFQDEPETAYFSQIQDAATEGKQASEIIKSVLKCTRSEAGHSRHYSEVGKPAFVYLVRKYGSIDLLNQFKDSLEG